MAKSHEACGRNRPWLIEEVVDIGVEDFLISSVLLEKKNL